MILEIIFFIIIIAILFLVFRFIKKIIYLILSLVGLILLVSSLFILLSYLDYNNLKEGMNQNSLILLTDCSNYMAGFSVPLNNIAHNDAYNPINDIESYNKKKKKELLNDYYKLFVIGLQFLETNLQENVVFDSKSIGKRRLINALIAQNPINELPELADTNYTINEIKAGLFAGSVQSIIKNKGSLALFEGYKQGNITIYKETMLFRLIKLLPISYLNKYITN